VRTDQISNTAMATVSTSHVIAKTMTSYSTVLFTNVDRVTISERKVCNNWKIKKQLSACKYSSAHRESVSASRLIFPYVLMQGGGDVSEEV